MIICYNKNMEKNEFLEIIKTRRSVRSFIDKQVSNEDLKMILEAGEFAPSGMGKQSPYFVVIQDKKEREEVMKLNASFMGIDKDPYYNAPTIILVLGDSNVHTYVEDCSCAIENMLLMAHALNIDSIWIHREKEMFDSIKGKELLAKWGLSNSLAGVGAIALGYRSENFNPVVKPRKKDYFKII